MTGENLARCRRLVQNHLGSELHDKASDPFCLRFGATGAAPPRVRGMVEFVPEPLRAPSAGEAAMRLRQAPGVRDALGVVLAALEGLDESLAARARLLLEPAELLREAYIRETRERRHRLAADIRSRLNHAVEGAEDADPDADGIPDEAASFCWINQTLRTWTDPRALAEIAGDPTVARIDVPRGLHPEIDTTGSVVGAVQHRAITGRTGKGVVVAVIDFEVDRGHPAFGDRVIQKKNYTREDWGHPGAHGTAVAGIIAAGGRLSGMAPDAVIYNYKVFASALPNSGEDFDGALGLQRALEDGAKVANCSWGTDAPTDGLSREARACDNVWAAGMTVVNSVGNGGRDAGSMTSPSDASGVIAVGATDRDGKGVQPYSGRGPTANGRAPHLVAPGGRKKADIHSCLDRDFGNCGFGTSLAAPHVAGLLAVLLEGHPGLTPNEQRDRLLALCTRLPGGDDNVQGKGLASIAALA